jgi:tripartite-type tricarboxylate transporter receptor subunit TctC
LLSEEEIMPISQKRRSLVLGSMGAIALGPNLLAADARAQAWPSRPIRFIVSFPPGGLTDLYARAYAEQIGQSIGQPVIVENRPGGGGLIGADAVAKAAPDGHMFLFTISTTVVQSRVLYKKMPFDADKDFTFISAMGAGPLPLVVHRDVPAKDAKEYVALARAKSINMGSFATASTPHMVAQQMNKLYGTKIEPVHYKGEASMLQELIAGRIESAIGSYAAIGPHVRSGAVRALAVSTPLRSPGLPDMPTFIEQGFDAPIFRVRGWIGMLGPAGLPREIAERMSRMVAAGADTERMRQLYAQFGIPDKPTSPAEFERIYREEGPIWIAIARELGVTLD